MFFCNTHALIKGCMNVFKMLKNIKAEYSIKAFFLKRIWNVLKIPLFDDTIAKADVHVW